MKLAMYKYGERNYRLGAVLNDECIVDLNYGYEVYLCVKKEQSYEHLAKAVLPSESVNFLHAGERAWEAANIVMGLAKDFTLETTTQSDKRVLFKRNEVKLGSPVQNPMRIVCLSHNYHDFCEETGNPIPSAPRIFSKYNNALCGPDDPIIYPRMTNALGYEVELAFVIGKKGRFIPKAKAFDHIAGYMVMNDVSASDLTGLDKQVLRGKTFDNFAPCGPYLVSKDEVGDPGNLDVKLWVNDKQMQASNTSKLIYDVPTLVSFLSEVFTLIPGDIIATGTPGGLAKDRKPPTFMQVGDVCALEIQKIGRLSNIIIAEESTPCQ